MFKSNYEDVMSVYITRYPVGFYDISYSTTLYHRKISGEVEPRYLKYKIFKDTEILTPIKPFTFKGKLC